MELSTISTPNPHFGPRPSVEIRQAYKRYSVDTVVLNGLNMTVPNGGIYALLGSSGCGKSTLLNCIVGQCTLDSGSIKLNVSRRSKIGFMPQNLCLTTDLSIYENMLIFGYLNGVTKERIFSRADELIDLFQLPSGERPLETLSGGQQRRVSMAIAFLHDPSIVILDEPTVGVDINLTQVIWEYFIQKATTGQTILITTHYIQEAHRAHTIGMLRKGILIAEENPQSLVERYVSDNLESVFLALSQKQQEKKGRYLSRRESRFPMDKGPLRKPYFIDDEKPVCVRRMKSVLYKNIVQLIRHYGFILLIMVLPVVQILNFHYAYGGLPEKLKIGFVSGEISVQNCNYTSYSGCILTNENFYLSCVFMDLFRNRTYKMKEYNDEASAIRAVKKNEIWGALKFVKNYTQLAIEIIRGNETQKEMALESMKISFWVDLSSNFVGTFVKRETFEYFTAHWKIALEQCGLPSKLLNYPGGISFHPALNVAGDSKTAAMSSSVPSMLLITSVCLGSMAAAMVGTEEKLAGTILRMQAAGLSVYEFLIGLLIVQVAFHVIRIFSIIILIYAILGYTQRGDLLTLILLMFFAGLLGILFGIISSVMTSNPTVTMITQYGFTYGVAFCSGLMWPIEGQQSFFRFINNFLPFTWSTSAGQGITLREFSFTNGIVLEGFGMAIAWIIIFFLILGYISKYRAYILIGG